MALHQCLANRLQEGTYCARRVRDTDSVACATSFTMSALVMGIGKG